MTDGTDPAAFALPPAVVAATSVAGAAFAGVAALPEGAAEAAGAGASPPTCTVAVSTPAASGASFWNAAAERSIWPSAMRPRSRTETVTQPEPAHTLSSVPHGQ